MVCVSLEITTNWITNWQGYEYDDAFDIHICVRYINYYLAIVYIQ